MRSVNRDIKTMALGIDVIDQEIKFWESKSKKDKSIQNRVERLYTARKHLIENPKASEELIQRLP
tara:strand:- start:483 stop:677 length:195 start_codon:yes stop_codon:yes gene_type:complete